MLKQEKGREERRLWLVGREDESWGKEGVSARSVWVGEIAKSCLGRLGAWEVGVSRRAWGWVGDAYGD